MKSLKTLVERMSKNYNEIDDFIKTVFTAWQIIGSTLLFASLFIGLCEHYGGYRFVSETTAEKKDFE